MADYYHAPALALSALLLPAFGYLYFRFRDSRTLLWFLGFILVLVSMTLRYFQWPWSVGGKMPPWADAVNHTSILIGSALFIASLTPLRFRVGRMHVLYVVPYTIPLVIASVIFYGVFQGVSPSGPLLLIFPALGAISVVAVLFWGAAQNRMPVWIGVSFCASMGCLTLWVCFRAGAAWALTYAECGNFLMTALLVAFVFRRLTPGVILSVLGFTAWSLSALQIIPAIGQNPVVNLNMVHIIVMGKVVAALGMILVALEDELHLNEVAQDRERRARRELEAYTNLILARRREEDFDGQADGGGIQPVCPGRAAAGEPGPVSAGRVSRAGRGHCHSSG